MSTTPRFHRVRRGITALACAAIAVAAWAGGPLFPKPLHIVRVIDDGLATKTITVHEYCAGNRIATVNGDRVAIVDYEALRVVEIDRKAGTYSITPFEDLPPRASEPSGKLEVEVDRRVELSRDAIEALSGGVLPRERRRVASESVEKEALPTSQVRTFEIGGQTLVVKNTIVSITNELAPAELLAIPPGARQVESRATRTARELRELDTTPR